MKINNKSFGLSLELKGDKARPFTQYSPRFKGANDYFFSYVDSNPRMRNLKFDQNPFGGDKNIRKTIEQLYGVLKNEREVFDVVYHSFLAQFGISDELTEEDKNKLAKTIFNKGDVNDVLNSNGVSRLLFAIQLYDYWTRDKFNYFVMFDTESGDYKCENTQNFSIMHIFYNLKHVRVVNGTGGKNSNNPRENFVQMEYKK